AVADAPAILRRDDDVALADRLAHVGDVVLVQMAADVLVHPDDRGVSARGGAELQRLKDEGRHVEIAHPGTVGDLVHRHEAFAGGAPFPIGFGLLLEIAREIAGPPLKAALTGEVEGETRQKKEDESRPVDQTSVHAPNLTTGPNRSWRAHGRASATHSDAAPPLPACVRRTA